MLLPALSRVVGVISRHGGFGGTPSPSLYNEVYAKQSVSTSSPSHEQLGRVATGPQVCGQHGRYLDEGITSGFGQRLVGPLCYPCEPKINHKRRKEETRFDPTPASPSMQAPWRQSASISRYTVRTETSSSTASCAPVTGRRCRRKTCNNARSRSERDTIINARQ